MTEYTYSIISICVVLICLANLLLFIYFYLGWKATPFENFSSNSKTFHTRVSVIVAARNEEKNIENCLASLIGQKYPASHFEILVVDDNSTDSTLQKIQECINQYANISIQAIQLDEIKNNLSPKKRAIESAMKSATGELVLTTDADCIVCENWITTMVRFYEKTDAQMIVGPVKIKLKKNASWLHQFQNFEFMSLVTCGAASLHFHRALLSNGANLAFKKTAYLTCSPLQFGQKLASGDDMFLMLAIQKKFPKSIYFLKSKEAIVETNAQNTLVELVNQRKRWASKGLNYKNNFIYLISFLLLSINLALLTTSIISFFSGHFLQLFLVLFLTKFAIDLFFLTTVAKFFNSRVNALKIGFYSLVYPLLVLTVVVAGINPKFTWKDRNLK